MALELTVTSSTGLEIENAYIRIDEYSCINTTINARVRAYVSKEMREQGRTFIEGTEEIITLEGDYSDSAVNTKKQIYEYMKTLEKYQDAVDVLE